MQLAISGKTVLVFPLISYNFYSVIMTQYRSAPTLNRIMLRMLTIITMILILAKSYLKIMLFSLNATKEHVIKSETAITTLRTTDTQDIFVLYLKSLYNN